MWVKHTMKQIIQSRRSGKLALKQVPKPRLKPGYLLVQTTASLISTGTERKEITFAKKNLLAKANSRPDLGSVHPHAELPVLPAASLIGEPRVAWLMKS